MRAKSRAEPIVHAVEMKRRMVVGMRCRIRPPQVAARMPPMPRGRYLCEGDVRRGS